MKTSRFTGFLFILLISLAPFLTSAQDEAANLVGFIASDSAINVRNRPNGAVVASLRPNISVAVLDKSEDGTWLSVELPDGKTGWVSASFVRVVESAVPADLVPITPENADQLQLITELASILSNGFAISPDGRILASHGWKGGVEVYDIRTKTLITELAEDSGITSAAVFSPDGSELATGGAGGAVRLWNTQTWGERTEFAGHSDDVTALAYSPDGAFLASAGEDRKLIIWNVKTSERVHEMSVDTDHVDDVVFSPDGSSVSAGGYWASSRLGLWSTTTGEKIWGKVMGGNLHLVYSHDGQTLMVAATGFIAGYDVENGAQTLNIANQISDGSSMAINPEGTLIGTGGWKAGAFTLVGIESQKVLFYDDSQGATRDAAIILGFSPDGRLLITSDGDTAIRLWGVRGGG